MFLSEKVLLCSTGWYMNSLTSSLVSILTFHFYVDYSIYFNNKLKKILPFQKMYHKSKQIIWERSFSPMFNCCHFVTLSGHESLIKYYYHLCGLLYKMYTECQWFPILVISTQLSRWTDIFFTGSACPSKCKIYLEKLLDEFDLFVLMSHLQITRLQLTHANKMYKHFSKVSLKFRLPSKNHTNSKKGLMWIFQWKHSHVVWK